MIPLFQCTLWPRILKSSNPHYSIIPVLKWSWGKLTSHMTTIKHSHWMKMSLTGHMTTLKHSHWMKMSLIMRDNWNISLKSLKWGTNEGQKVVLHKMWISPCFDRNFIMFWPQFHHVLNRWPQILKSSLHQILKSSWLQILKSSNPQILMAPWHCF